MIHEFRCWNVEWDASTAREGVDVSKLPVRFKINAPARRDLLMATIAQTYGCSVKHMRYTMTD